jgi:membrane protease YdiL (CAAX protease family)
MKKKTTFFSALEIFFILVFPILLLKFGVLPLQHRVWLFVPVSLMIFLSVWREKEKWSWKKLGVRNDNLKTSFLPYLLATVSGVGVILVLAHVLGRHPLTGWQDEVHFQFMFVVSSFYQEFVYRGYLMPKLESMFSSSWIVIIANAGLFTFLHIIFPNLTLILPLLFTAGVVFALMYKRYPNLLLISLAHSAVNFTAVLYCFASLATHC